MQTAAALQKREKQKTPDSAGSVVQKKSMLEPEEHPEKSGVPLFLQRSILCNLGVKASSHVQKHTPVTRKPVESRSLHSPLVNLQHSLGNYAYGRMIQTKLKIGEPGDIYEQEADRVADHVMRMPESRVQRRSGLEEEEEEMIQPKPLGVLQRQCEGCEEEELIQPKPIGAGAREISTDMGSEINSLKGGGQPLSQTERDFFEPRFGYDFSHVRVHTDAGAAASACAIDARAYSIGENIVFGSGQYSPSTIRGKQLIAHELTHFIQQSSSPLHRNQKNKPNIVRTDSPNYPSIITHSPGMSVQCAAPAAVGVAALLKACVLGALAGALIDLGFQHAKNLWWRFRDRTTQAIDYCMVLLSAALGCVGGMVAARWLGPWLDAQLGPKLGGVSGSLLGKILIWLSVRASLTPPRWVIKQLLALGCITDEEADIIGGGRQND